VPGVTTRLGVLALAAPENGGTYQYTLSMLEALRHVEGFQITIYGDPSNADFLKMGFPISPFNETRPQQIAALTAHWTHIRLPDRFATEDVLLAPIYSLALLHTTKPFAYTLHDLQERYYPQNFNWRQRAWRHQVHQALLARAGRVVCESSYVKSDIARFFGLAEQRATVIPAPPQLQFRHTPSQDQLDAIRIRLQLPDRFLFYPAQFWAHKNHMRLVEAFRGVVDEVPDVKLVLTGKKRDEYQNVMEAVVRLGLNERVIHLGFVEQSDLQAIYRLASALVVPSLFESVSIPIYEAFQLGTPVVASNILAIPEQVGDAALLFDPVQVDSIRDTIVKVLRDPEAARRRAEHGRERMLRMTPESYGRQLQGLLEGLQ
jgi:glycosyltransferase involved in cell wall biosynthesis